MMRPEQVPHREKNVAYNAFRGFCAVGIFCSHMSWLATSENVFWRTVWQYFMRYGSQCTTFFFVLSGFLLCYTWKDGVSYPAYLKRKLNRFYPLAFCVFLLALVCNIVLAGDEAISKGVTIGSGLWWFNVIANVFLFKAFIPDERIFYSFHAPSWYLSALMVFYALFYFYLRRLKEAKGEQRILQIRIGGGLCLTAYLAEAILCLAVDRYQWEGASLYWCYVNPWFRMFGEGMAGILLCETMPDIQSWCWRKGLSVNGMEWCALGLFIVSFPAHSLLRTTLASAWLQIIPAVAVLISFRSGEGTVSKRLAAKGWQWLGTVSFELYMTHAFVYEGIPVIAGVVSPGLKQWLMLHGDTRFLMTAAAALCFATLTHMVFAPRKYAKRKPII